MRRVSLANRVALAEIDLSIVNSPSALQDALALALQLPEWYGHNWDEFRKCVADPTLSSMPERLVLRGFTAFAQRLPRDAAILIKTFEDLSTIRPGQACFLTIA